MKIDDLTIGEAKQLASMFSGKSTASHSFTIGEQVIIRTVTNYYTGRITSVTDTDVVLEDAAWIADTGRWADALAKCTVSEAEPYLDPAVISRGAIVDWTKWRGQLPKVQK